MSKKKPQNGRAIEAQYRNIVRERTRIIGDMLLLSDSSEDYQAKEKLLADLNSDIERLEASLGRRE